jgi:hypothetical protein
MSKTKKTLRRALKARRGQAMMSYALITMILLGGLVASSTLIVPQVINALDSYSANIYFCINSPIP